jgi:hypothetical protein
VWEVSLSIFAPRSCALRRIRANCFFLAFFTFLTAIAAHTQTTPSPNANTNAKTPETTVPAKVPAAETTPPAPAQPQAAAATTPQISSVTVSSQPISQTSSTSASTQNPMSTFTLEIVGKGFESITDPGNVRIIVFPSTGVVMPLSPVIALSTDKSMMFAQFTAPTNLALEQVAVSLTGSTFATFDTGTAACDFATKVVVTPQIVSKEQAGNKYGNGVGDGFHVIQLSIVNACSMPIVVPLAGITIVPHDQPTNDNPTDKIEKCEEAGALVPFSLDHVTSLYSSDRKLTGRRAIYFNVVQALATIGSAVEPFFAHGFTQGVAILGGGFTTASKEIMVDMSTEQLQNITSQSFGSTEQISSGGSLQKFVFVRRNKHKECRTSTIETDLRTGEFEVQYQLTPASAQAPTTQSAPATPTPKQTGGKAVTKPAS